MQRLLTTARRDQDAARGDPRGHLAAALAADVPAWLRPDAEASLERLFCHVQGREKNAGQRVPGWPYSFVAARGAGRVVVDAAAGRGADRPGR
jgi:hypothetical protein